MTYWAWVPGLETGLAEIDRQHRRLVEYVNLLAEAMEELDVTKTEAVLDALIHYTVVHFRFEEKVMKKAGYGRLDAHRQVHEAFKDKVLSLKKEVDAGTCVNDDMMAMLVKWILTHIKKEDMLYVDAIRPVLENRSWLSKLTDKMFSPKL